METPADDTFDFDVYSGPRVPLLDHGYLQLVNVWGSERQIVEAARQSTQKGFEGWGPFCTECGWSKGDDHEAGCSRPDTYKPGDEKLLAYLWKNRHDTPFEMAGLTFEVQAPIFVFREWHRHRVPFGYSEASARYAPLPALDYLPTVERMMQAGPTRNKQAASVDDARELNTAIADSWLSQLEILQRELEELYQVGLRAGVPKELARLAMTVGRYSRMRATGNLRGWLGFLDLRATKLGSSDLGPSVFVGKPLPNQTAQHEIRVYADAISAVIEEHFPRVHALHAAGR